MKETSMHTHETATWRSLLVEGQKPFATVLGCSDSRVLPEMVFDVGFGDIFAIRLAGNIIAEDVIGSMQYAVAHLHTPLIIVLGHEGCGAVSATVEEMLGKTEVFLIVLVWTAMHYLGASQMALDSATWYATIVDEHRQYSPAGYWYAFVSIPVFQFLLARWFFRIFIWARFLRQVSRLDLHLVPTHPDRAAGLGFLVGQRGCIYAVTTVSRRFTGRPDRQPHFL